VVEMRKWSFRGAPAKEFPALAETLSDCDGRDEAGRVVGVRAPDEEFIDVALAPVAPLRVPVDAQMQAPLVDPQSGRVLPAGGGVAAMMSQSGLAPPRAAPRLPGLETLATPGPGADRERAALDALLWQGIQELRDAYRALAPAPAPEKPSEGLNALALATQMEL